MSVNLINGDGVQAVYAAQDADWYAGLTGETTCILPVNDKLASELVDSNTLQISSGVVVSKEGRRIQIDEGDIEEVIIPTGAQGVTNYYIVGFREYIDEQGTQMAEPFIESVESATATIAELTFKEGASEVYVSLYRLTQEGLVVTEISRICPYMLDLNEIADESGNTSSALVEQSIGTFPEFAISTNSADSYYSAGRGGVRDSNDKIIIIGMCRYNEGNSGKYYVGFMLYGTSAQALAQSSYTQYGAIGHIRTFVTPQGNTVYVTWQSNIWVYNTVTNPYTAGSTTVTINGNAATLHNVFVQNTSGVITSSQADKMLLTIVEEILFGTKEYSSGIYQVKSNNEIISLFENSVAHNEPTTTASQSYAKGEYLTQGGNLKKVTSAIASGDNISDSNTSDTTVASELSRINSDLTDKLYSNNIEAIGRINVNQKTGIHANGNCVGTWYKFKNSNNCYIDYTINYYQQTPSSSDTIKLVGYPSVNFIGHTGTAIKTTTSNSNLQFSATGSVISGNVNSQSLQMVGLGFSSSTPSGACGRYTGFLYV